MKNSTRGVTRTLLVFCFALLGITPLRAETLISCSGEPGGDFIDRGFYVPKYPGTTLESVRLVFSTQPEGSYRIRLTARLNAYNGPLLGSTVTNFTTSGSYSQDVPVTFQFGGVSVSKGSTVCFLMTKVSGPGDIFYSVPDWVGGCTEVIETENTSPPLSTHRRDGVNVVITGEDSGRVTAGGSIQAAIDASDPGEVVFVEPGTYNEDLTLRSDVSVIGSGFDSTILQGTGAGSVVTANNVTNCQFEGFKITGSGTGGSSAGVLIQGGDMLLNNNWIIGNKDGVRVHGPSSPIIRNNIIEGNGVSGGFLDYGIIVLHATPLIANNLVVSNDGAGMYIAWPDSEGAQVINNTVADNLNEGIWCYNVTNAVIKNNITTGNSTGISASHGARPLISFNDVWGNRWRDYDSQSDGVAAPGLGDISEDPRFDLTASPPFSLLEDSPCIDAGDPDPIYNDRDGTRNDMGAFGGPTGLLPGLITPVTSGFVFTSIGKIPTSEITQTGSRAGLANVSGAVANALHIYQYKDAPFGGNLWLNGLFGPSDAWIPYYRIYAAKWNGNSPPADEDFVQLMDPLSKIKYTIQPDGKVVASLEKVGPDENGLYLRTDRPNSGYWAHPDLKMIWNTRRVENGKYDLICQGYFIFFGIPIPATLPTNELTRITVYVDNNPVEASINVVKDRFGNDIPECGVIPVSATNEPIQFNITASHPTGFLRNYRLDALYGRNRDGGIIAADQYVGVHEATGPLWVGVSNFLTNTAPAHASGALLPWTTCAYQFRLRAWARTTDGFNHIYRREFNDHYYITLGQVVPSTCVADLDKDGDVDGADLAIFVAQFGRTNCVSSPAP